MITCPRCETEHDGSGLPPSLTGKMKTCSDCYKLMKKLSDKDWRDKNPGMATIYKRRARAKDPQATAEEWKARSERFRYNKQQRKAKKKGK